MCLCGILGTETSVLPDGIVAELNIFFDQNVSWLERAYSEIGVTTNVKKKAVQTLSLLEGAMMISTSKKDLNFFDLSTQLIIEEVSEKS